MQLYIMATTRHFKENRHKSRPAATALPFL